MKRMMVFLVLVAASLSLMACTNTAAQGNNGGNSVTVNVPKTVTDSYRVEVVGITPWVVPQGMTFEDYPIIGHPLTDLEAMRMKLRKEPLAADTLLHNEDRRAKNFPVENIKAGTIIWVNSASQPVYKADCGNRVMKPIQHTSCPDTVTCPAPTNTGTTGTGSKDNNAVASTDGGNPSGGNNVSGGSRSFGSTTLGSLLNGLGNILGIILLLAIIAAAIMLALWLLSMLWNWIQDQHSNRAVPPNRIPPPFIRQREEEERRRQAADEAARQPGPRPIPAADVPPQRPDPDAAPLGVGPAGNGLVWRRRGPYHMVTTQNAGRRGQRVTGYFRDGRSEDLGIIQDSYTEDLGEAGHAAWILTN